MFEIDKRKFGAFIAELRKEKGLTQKGLAEKLFISDKAVSKWETGQSIPDITLLRPLAEILGVTTTELLECKRLEPDIRLDAKRTDELLQKVIEYPEKDGERFNKARKRDAVMFVSCMLLGVAETILYANMSGEPMWVVTGPSSVNFSGLVTIELLCFIFGIYFCFFAKDKLPAYYDEEKISSYSHGIFRMNLPGIHFDNSNWPHILKIARMWCMLTAAIFPLVCIGFWKFFVARWGIFHLVSFGVIILGGLFIPLYIVAKKYE